MSVHGSTTLLLLTAALSMIPLAISSSAKTSFHMNTTKEARLTCINCRSCKVFEESSQTAACGQGQNMCLRADMTSGEVERRCATDGDCLHAKDSGSYLSVTCCNWSNCNGVEASKTKTKATIFMALIAIVLTTSL